MILINKWCEDCQLCMSYVHQSHSILIKAFRDSIISRFYHLNHPINQTPRVIETIRIQKECYKFCFVGWKLFRFSASLNYPQLKLTICVILFTNSPYLYREVRQMFVSKNLKQNVCLSARSIYGLSAFSFEPVFSPLPLHVLFIHSCNNRSQSVAPSFIFSFNQLIAQQHGELFPERGQKEIAWPFCSL